MPTFMPPFATGNPAILLLLADLVLAAHTALALFLAFGLAAIWLGHFLGDRRGWGFVRNRRFRLAHLAGLGVVALESLLGLACPLTDLEAALRVAAQPIPGTVAYRGGCVAHWLGRILFYDFDEGVFTAAYLAALGLTLLAWRVVRVRRKG